MPRVRTSPTTPTISRGALTLSLTCRRICLPTGFSPGQKRRAAASLMSATRAPVSVSRAVSRRPLFSGIDSASM